MTLSIWILATILLVAFALFIHGRLPVDVVGLLVLSSLALTGLVTPHQALAGFSSPAVITVWAMFILSAGLTRTGIAHALGKPLQRFAKGGEVTLQIALMLSASVLSALINTVTVAAILLPATMELARRSGRSPSRLLMPLALGSLLGGPFTGISTPPNILVTEMLESAGFQPFGIFDFTPITGAIVVSGIIFMVLIGRHLIPDRVAATKNGSHTPVGTFYQLDTHIFAIRIPDNSPLNGRTLSESRLGSALYLTVLALQRNNTLILAPRPDHVLESRDTLIVHGRPDKFRRFHGSQHLQVESEESISEAMLTHLSAAEGIVTDHSSMRGITLEESGLRRKYRIHVLALVSSDGKPIRDLRRHHLEAGDRLLLQGDRQSLERVVSDNLVSDLQFMATEAVNRMTDGHADLLSVRVPDGSALADHDLVESRLGNAFGLTVIGILREDNLIFMPFPEEKVNAGDTLLLQGSRHDLQVLEGLQDLEIEEQSSSLVAELESQEIGAAEVLLSPRTALAGKTLADLLFRDHYGLSVLAIWRKGRPFRSGLQDMPLQFGDALLVYGKRRNLEAVAKDPNFLVLDHSAARAPHLEKAQIAAGIMAAVLLSAIFGLVPISIAGLTGAAVMVLVGCLSMEEAYRAIEWKVVFLIAGMLPLGVAIENTGAAKLGAEALIAAAGGLGPRWVVAALFLVTVIGTQIIPTAALVVLMAPIALNTAATLNISPHLLMMTVAIAASASFASPLSHPAHLLVMGPGGYRFTDYIRVGVPLTLVAMVVAVWLLPILWPA